MKIIQLLILKVASERKIWFNIVRFCSIIITSICVYLAPAVQSATIKQCYSDLTVALGYDTSSNSINIVESNDNLSLMNLKLDAGFAKLFEADEAEFILFRQTGIKNGPDVQSNFIVRYEAMAKSDITRLSLIISDPMCIKDKAARISIFESSENKNLTSFYQCECFSFVHDMKNFILSQ